MSATAAERLLPPPPKKKRARAECVVCSCCLEKEERRERILHIMQCKEGRARRRESLAEQQPPCAAAAICAPCTPLVGASAEKIEQVGQLRDDAMTRMLSSARRVWGKVPTPNVFDRMMAVARDMQQGPEPEAAAEEEAETPNHRSDGRGGAGRRRAGGSSGWRRGGDRPLQAHKFVCGTPFVVDGFTDGAKDGRLYFLTHFHADHYGGLSRKWCETLQTRIQCSSITARLVVRKLGVPESKLERLPMNTPIEVGIGSSRATVELIDANHCPGAVLFMFRLANGRTILHTGDFRYEPSMGTHVLSRLGSDVLDTLYLDTTYCEPQHIFPTQESVVKRVLAECRLLLESKRTLVLFGAYTIGKERIFLEVARQLNVRLHVCSPRLSTLACLDLSPKDMARFTTDASATRCAAESLSPCTAMAGLTWPSFCLRWAVVPIAYLRFDRMRAMLKESNGRYTSVIAFRPTGWCASSSAAGSKPQGRTLRAGPLRIHEVPYSEHSSFAELQACVRTLQPRHIIPTVGRASTAREQVCRLKGPGAPPLQMQLADRMRRGGHE